MGVGVGHWGLKENGFGEAVTTGVEKAFKPEPATGKDVRNPGMELDRAQTPPNTDRRIAPGMTVQNNLFMRSS